MTPPPEMRRRLTWHWIVLLLALAALLRFYKLDSQLWLDEVVALVNSYRDPFWKILTKFPGHFPHPLYEQLAHGSLALFGESAFSIRLPAALFGVAGVFMFYKLSRRFSGEGEALLGTALLALSYHHIYFSQDARGYTLYLFLALAATDMFLDVLQKMRWQTALAYTAIAALAAYSQTAGLTLAPGQIAVGLAAICSMPTRARDDRPKPLHLLAMLALITLFIFLLYAPIISDSLSYVKGPAYEPTVSQVARAFDLIAELFNGLKSTFSNWPVLAGAALVCTIGGLDFLRQNPVALAVLVVPVIISVAAMGVIGAAAHARYFLLALITAYLLGTRGLVLLGRTLLRRFSKSALIRPAMAVGLVAFAALPLRAYYSMPKQDFLGALRQVRAVAGPSDRTMAAGLAAHIYRIYYAPDLLAAQNLSDLLREEASGHAVWVITTFERVEARQRPDLLAYLRRNYQLRYVLPASTGDGEMRIYYRATPAGTSR
jgi:mannosyltransferase